MYKRIEELGIHVYEHPSGIHYVDYRDLKRELKKRKLMEPFAKFFGIQTQLVEGPYAHDVEAALERCLSGRLTGSQLDWD